MNQGRTIFSQLMEYLPRKAFTACVNRYNGERYVKSFSCRDQFLSMAFAQLAYRESLRDIECCLKAHQEKLYQMGFRGRVTKSTLAHANEKRDWRIWEDLAGVLIRMTRKLYEDENLNVDLQEAAYAFDSTTIDLCLTVFPWARFRRTKAGVKAHTLLDLRGDIPCWVHVTPAKEHDVNALDLLPVEPASFYIMDRAYLDFDRLFMIHWQGAFFITRTKSNTKFQCIESMPVDTSKGLRADKFILLTGKNSKREYGERLRVVEYDDPKTGKRFTFLTNSFSIPAQDVADLYRLRWRVELFFKWIKQHLRIKAFFGTSENAVKTQIWIVIAVYVLVAIVKKRLKLDDLSLYYILQVVSVSLFEKKPLLEALRPPVSINAKDLMTDQLKLI